MPNRDYAAREKSKKGGNKLLIILVILLLIALSGLGLVFLQQSGAKEPTLSHDIQKAQLPKATLPSRPEETYSYIRDLETREVPVNKSSKYAQLSKEQEQQILKQQQLEKQKLEQLKQEQQARLQAETANQVKEQDQVLNEDKGNKQAEIKKQQELNKKIEQISQVKPEPNKTQAPQKVVATKAAEAPKPSAGKYGLQCGAFKNKAQAENMQARLAMAGYNARINRSAEWNRVVVGPIGDRTAASSAQSNARSVAECLIIGM